VARILDIILSLIILYSLRNIGHHFISVYLNAFDDPSVGLRVATI